MSSYRSLLVIILLAIAGTTSLLATTPVIPEVKENFHIFLLMGQSNMEGGASVDGDMDTVPHERVLKLNSWDSWELAVDPITNRLGVAVGPGLSFAKKLAEENEDITVGLIPLAQGSTRLNEWVKGTLRYEEILRSAGIANNLGVIKGVLWHQGEHDAIEGAEAISYGDRLEDFIAELRADLHLPHLPFIVGGLVDSPFINNPVRLHPYVWRRLKTVGTTFYQTGYARSGDLPYLPDLIHFTSESQRIMGSHYCDEYSRVSGILQSKLKPRLDETAVVDESGWKYHPEIGIYFDENYPFVKHAQLGWIRIDAHADGSLAIESALNGDFRTQADEEENLILIYRENEDPEELDPVQSYWVNLEADPEDEGRFYDNENEVWLHTIDEAADLDSIGEIYATAEQQFVKTQEAVAMLKVGILNNQNWSELTEFMKVAEKHRMFMILHSFDAYRYAFNQMPESNLRTFWLAKTLDLISRIDGVVLEGQIAWTEYSHQIMYGSEE